MITHRIEQLRYLKALAEDAVIQLTARCRALYGADPDGSAWLDAEDDIIDAARARNRYGREIDAWTTAAIARAR